MLENRMVIDELWNDEKEDLSEYYETMEELEERIDNINLLIENREMDILSDNNYYTEDDLIILENDNQIQDWLEEKEMLNEELKEIENYVG